MTTKKSGAAQRTMQTTDSAEAEVFVHIDPRLIDSSPFQHRTVFDSAEMDELKADIDKHGIHTPLIVRRHPIDPDKYELATGERRLRCAIDLGLTLVPVHIRPLTDRQVQELQWGENFRRVNPNPLEEAKGLRHLLAYHKTVDGLARYINKPRAYVLTRLQLLNLIDPIQDMVHAAVFNLKNSLEIACIDPKSQQAFFEEHCAKWKEKKGFRINNLNSALYSYRCDLDRAIFDLKDKDLVPEAGPCIRCVFNSASYQSLFPETVKRAYCNRQECYVGKSQAHLRIKVRELIDGQQPTAIVVSGKLDTAWQTLLAEIPEGAAWPRYDWTDVTTAHPPEEPDRDDFEDEDLPGGFDQEEYDAALEEFRTEQKDFEDSLQQGRIMKALYISGNRLETQYIDPEPADADCSQPKSLVTAAAVKTAIKAGTATPELLQGEVTRLRDREKRSQELDQDKIQKEVHTQFNQRILDPAAPPSLTPGDQLGIRLLLYQSLDYQGRSALNKQIPYEEEAEDGKQIPLTQWLGGLTEGQVALMTRLAIHHKSEALLPTYPTAVTLVGMAMDIGIDVPAIRTAQDRIAVDRQKRTTERIAVLEGKIATLKEKVIEPAS